MLPIWLPDTVTLDVDRALHYTLLWGLEGVELRMVGGPSDRVPFVNEARLRRRLDAHEVPAEAATPGLFEGAARDRAAWLNDLALLGDTLAFCRRLGCRRVVVSAFAEGAPDEADAVEALRRAGEVAQGQGFLLCALNEVGMAHPTGAALAPLLDAVDHPAVRAAWDPAAAAEAGEDPGAGLAALDGRIGLVRCRNVSGSGEPASLEAGQVDWPAQLRALYAAGFDGPVSLVVELHPAPKHGLRMATTLIQMIRSAKKG